MNAKKTAFASEQALALLDDVDELYVSKGKNVIHLDIKKDKLDRRELLQLLLGPTGNLRAPTLRVGRTLMVGFDEATYRKILAAQPDRTS